MGCYGINRSDQEINDVVNRASGGGVYGRSRWPSMTYEDGVRAAIDWIVGDSDDNPMED